MVIILQSYTLFHRNKIAVHSLYKQKRHKLLIMSFSIIDQISRIILLHPNLNL